MAVRLAGPAVLVPDEPLVLGVLYAVTVPAMAGVPLALYRLYGVARADRPRVAVLLVVPVAVLDAGALLAYGSLFPSLPPATARYFAAWALLAYVGAFATAPVADRARDGPPSPPVPPGRSPEVPAAPRGAYA